MSDSEDETVYVELAEWAKIQQKTFTRWTYQQLKVRDIAFDDLQFGFKDGVNLINLVELLTQQPAGRYTKKPKIKMQMVENIGIALKILTADGIKLVNIGNEDIYAGNLKLILGLVWTLILHYQISVDFGGDDGNDKSAVSAKKGLMNWASDLVNNLPNLPSGRQIKNFTTDWNDGVALCSMVEAVAPGLCPEFAVLDPEKRLENAQLGLDRAEEGLGVPKIIEAEDLINPNIDELSVLTYVSLLKNATPKIELKPVDPLKIKIYGPGIETAWVNTPTQFFVDTTDAGFGKLQVQILDKDGKKVPVELWKKDNETKVQYTPTTPGPHKFNVTYNTQPVPQGNFTVRVLAPSDASKVRLSGEGLDKAYVGKLAYFICDTSEAGEGDLDVTVVGPTGKIPVDMEQLGDMKLKVCYTPEKAGPTIITVKYSGSEVPESPLHVEVIDDIDPLKVKILSNGLDNVVANTPTKFLVCTAGAGNGDLKVTVLDSDGQPLKVTIGDIDQDNKEVRFTPEHPGKHKVSVTWSSLPVPGGDIDLEVAKPVDLTACIVTDLLNPIVGQPTRFTVDVSKVGSEDLNVDVIDSQGEPLQVTIASIGEGQYQATYTAQHVGPHKLNVKIEDKHVPGSAFTVYGVDPSKVVVNLDPDKEYNVGETVEVGVNMTEAGPGQLGIQLSAPPDSGADCQAKEVSPGNMVVTFTPSVAGDHVLNLTFNDNNVPSCPVTIKVVPKANAGAVVVEGDGLKTGQVGSTAIFTVDVSGAGSGQLEVSVTGPQGDVPVTKIEIGDGKYEIGYTPTNEGPHVIAVKFANIHVPGSAFRPVVTKAINPNDVLAYGKGLEEDTMSDTPGDSTPNSDDFVVLSETAKPTGETTKPDHPENEPCMSFSLVGGEGDPLSSQDQISIDPSTVLPDEDISCTTSDDISVLSISEKDDSHPKEDSSANTTPDITKREDLAPPKEGIESSKEDKDIIASEEAPMLADSPEVVVESEVDIELEVTPDVNVEDSIVTEVHAAVPEVTAEVKTTTETEPDFDHKVEDKPETEVGPESQDEPEIKPYVDSSEVTTGSSDSEEPEEEIKEEKVKEVIEPAKKYNIYPLIHAVCFTLVTLHLIIPATSTDISLSPGSISVGSALLAYFLTATLIDFKILSDATFSLWMKDVFNVLVLPLVVCHIGCTCYYPDLDPEMAKINQAGCIIFSILAVVECIIIRQQLDVKCIAIGLVGVATATVLSQRFSQIGEVEPLLEEDGK